MCIIYKPYLKKYIFIFRRIYPPLDDYYFLMIVSDWNKSFRPISLSLVDIPTALQFFGDYKKARETIELEVAKCVETWNESFAGLPPVRIKHLIYVYLFIYTTKVTTIYTIYIIYIYRLNDSPCPDRLSWQNLKKGLEAVLRRMRLL